MVVVGHMFADQAARSELDFRQQLPDRPRGAPDRCAAAIAGLAVRVGYRLVLLALAVRWRLGGLCLGVLPGLAGGGRLGLLGRFRCFGRLDLRAGAVRMGGARLVIVAGGRIGAGAGDHGNFFGGPHGIFAQQILDQVLQGLGALGNAGAERSAHGFDPRLHVARQVLQVRRQPPVADRQIAEQFNAVVQRAHRRADRQLGVLRPLERLQELDGGALALAQHGFDHHIAAGRHGTGLLAILAQGLDDGLEQAAHLGYAAERGQRHVDPVVAGGARHAFAADPVDHARHVAHVHDLVDHRNQRDGAAHDHGGLALVLLEVAQDQVLEKFHNLVNEALAHGRGSVLLFFLAASSNAEA